MEIKTNYRSPPSQISPSLKQSKQSKGDASYAWVQGKTVDEKFGLVGGKTTTSDRLKLKTGVTTGRTLDMARSVDDQGFELAQTQGQNQNYALKTAIYGSDYDIETAGLNLDLSPIEFLPSQFLQSDLYDAFAGVAQRVSDELFDLIYENADLNTGRILSIQEIESVARFLILDAVLIAGNNFWPTIPSVTPGVALLPEVFVPAWLRAAQNETVALDASSFLADLQSDAINYALETYDYWQSSHAYDAMNGDGTVNAFGEAITAAAAAGAEVIAAAAAAGRPLLSPRPPSNKPPPAAKNAGMSMAAKVGIGVGVGAVVGGLIWYFTKKK